MDESPCVAVRLPIEGVHFELHETVIESDITCHRCRDHLDKSYVDLTDASAQPRYPAFGMCTTDSAWQCSMCGEWLAVGHEKVKRGESERRDLCKAVADAFG